MQEVNANAPKGLETDLEFLVLELDLVLDSSFKAFVLVKLTQSIWFFSIGAQFHIVSWLVLVLDNSVKAFVSVTVAFLDQFGSCL
nr:hypothetical protein CFP56_15411 [Quercus suber]